MTAESVRVWWADLARPPIPFERLVAALTPDERVRADRFRHAIHRNAWIAARGLLRHLLADECGLAPAGVRLATGPNGKPALDDARCALRFNLAHAGPIALFALSRDAEVGVDVEAVQARSVQAIAERFFAVPEIEWLRALPDGDRQRGFIRLWVCKEAYVKASGGGIAAFDLSSFAVDLRGGQPLLRAETSKAPPDLDRWTLRELPAPPGFAAAVATDRGPIVIEQDADWDWRGPVSD